MLNFFLTLIFRDIFTNLEKNDKMKKFAKVLLTVLILLIICVSIYMITPKAKVTKTYSAGKSTLKASPIKNEDGSVTYKNVKPDVFCCMKRKLSESGVQVPQGNEGDIEGYGTKIHFKRDNETNFTITIKDKPCYISNETIIGKITAFVHDCGGS
jgi:hypothetical protein